MKNIFRQFFELQYPDSVFSRSAAESSPNQEDLNMGLRDVQAVVHQYAEVLERSSVVINDEKNLPTNKQKLKLAFLIALRIETKPSQRKLLKDGFIMLGSFLPMTNAEKAVVQEYVRTEKATTRLKYDSSRDQKKEALASVYATFPSYASLVERVFSECDALARELKAAGVS